MRNLGYEYVFNFKLIVNNTQYQNNEQYSLLFEKKNQGCTVNKVLNYHSHSLQYLYPKHIYV